MTKAPWPSPSLKSKVSGMASNGSKVRVKLLLATDILLFKCF